MTLQRSLHTLMKRPGYGPEPSVPRDASFGSACPGVCGFTCRSDAVSLLSCWLSKRLGQRSSGWCGSSSWPWWRAASHSDGGSKALRVKALRCQRDCRTGDPDLAGHGARARASGRRGGHRRHSRFHGLSPTHRNRTSVVTRWFRPGPEFGVLWERFDLLMPT